MRLKQRVRGKFVSGSGFRKIVCQPGGRYELLIVDQEGHPVAPLTEWYRLRTSPGPQGTKRTYLSFLLPFFASLHHQRIAWNAEPAQVRQAVKAFLLNDVSCCVGRDTTLDGYHLDLTGASPLAPSSLRVLLAAIRDFYAVMIEAGLYAYANPMCSELLLRWKQEHLKALANSGAPDHAGIREESWQETHTRPTAYFRPRRGDVWKPDPALTSAHIQQQLATDLTWMTQHASTQRDRLILLLLRETGARLSEILGLTAGGYRKASDPYQAYVTNKGSHGREEKLITFTPAIEAALVRYVRTERVRYDSKGRKRLAALDDHDPIFLTRRQTAYTRDAFYHHWRRLFAARPPQSEIGSAPSSLQFTPHDIRHLRVTEWLTALAPSCQGDARKERLLRRVIQRRMGWRSPLTIDCYDHACTEREEEDLFAAFQHAVETRAATQAASATVSPPAPQAVVHTPMASLDSVAQKIQDELAFWQEQL